VIVLEEVEQVRIATPGLDHPGQVGGVIASLHDVPGIKRRFEGGVDAEFCPVLDDHGSRPVNGRASITQAHHRHFELRAVRHGPLAVFLLHASVQHELFGCSEITLPPPGPNILLDNIGIGWHQVAQGLAGFIGDLLGGGGIVRLVVLPTNLDGEVK